MSCNLCTDACVQCIPIANPNDEAWHDSDRREGPLFLISFGAYGWTRIYVWADSFDSALDEAAEWCADNAPGVFTVPEYDEAATELGAPADWREDEGWCEKVRDAAEVDLMYTESGYIPSWEANGHEADSDIEIVRARSRIEAGNDVDDEDTDPWWQMSDAVAAMDCESR